MEPGDIWQSVTEGRRRGTFCVCLGGMKAHEGSLGKETAQGPWDQAQSFRQALLAALWQCWV